MVNTLMVGQIHVPGPLTMILAAIGLFPIVFSNSLSNRKEGFKLMSIESQLASLDKADIWINSKPITGAELKGKVVLIEFGTYTCINWIRTLPYVRSWEQKYKDNGLIVIGIHTPEFPFEKNVDNVRQAITDMKIDFPIAIDNEFKIWNAFSNQYWPAIYLLDATGRVVHQQFGEGGYEQTETVLQHLLNGASNQKPKLEPISVSSNSIEAAADWDNLKSEENYLGYERTEENSYRSSKVVGRPYTFYIPQHLRLNEWGLSGGWTLEKQSITSNESNGKIAYHFHARDLHLVMGSLSITKQIRFRVLLDGLPPGVNHGKDIDEQGYGYLSQQRLYQLVRQTGNIKDHTFEIEFFDSGAEAFSFTFG